jgi:hypothetical protein
VTTSSPPASIDEHDLCAAWAAFRAAGELRTTDGQRLDIVHLGSWTHGFGPDFQDAMICLDGVELRTGSVELHLRTRGWTDHGHHLDPRYNTVVLHVVAEHDWVRTVRQDGVEVPVLHLPVEAAKQVGSRVVDVWSLVGGAVCAEDLTRREPDRARAILKGLGDVRLSGREARIEALLHDAPPAHVLIGLLFDALGYSANREPMRAVADQLLICHGLDRLVRATFEHRLALSRALLLGIAGYLPLSPTEAHLAGLSAEELVDVESAWRSAAAWVGPRSGTIPWQTARVRPANHPVVRLSQAAALLVAIADQPVAAFLGLLDGVNAPDEALRDLAASAATPPLGIDRARAILTNVVVPFAVALSHATGDSDLEERAVAAWDRLPPAESNAKVRDAKRQVAGAAPLTGLGARGQQGLIHLHDTLCGPRRCYECPVANWVMSEEPSLPPSLPSM